MHRGDPALSHVGEKRIFAVAKFYMADCRIMKRFTVHAFYDAEAKVWCGSSEELPLTTEADTLDNLLARAVEIAPEIALLNGLAQDGEEVTIHLTADRVTTAAA